MGWDKVINKHGSKALVLGAVAASLLSGCARRAQQRIEAPASTSVAYVQGQPVQYAPNQPVAAAPNYQDVQIVQHQRQAIPQVPKSLGQETLSTGEQVTVVTYVHHYPQAVDTYPSVYWSGRWYYNVQGNFVFWDPFWSTWAFYWGPPRPLVMAWNFQYPWVAYSWGMGFYGPGWYWGGVAMGGRHRLERPAPLGVNPAPLPAPPPRVRRATASRRTTGPWPTRSTSGPRPNALGAPRPNRGTSGRPNHRPGQAIASTGARPNRASARPNRASVSSPRPKLGQGRPNQPIPRPKQQVRRYRGTAGPSYIQPSRSRTRSGSRTVRVYRPRPAAGRPNGSSWPASSPSGGRANGTRHRAPSSSRPNYSPSPRPNYSRPSSSGRAAPMRIQPSPSRSSSSRGTSSSRTVSQPR